MTHYAVVSWDQEGRVKKYAAFGSAEEAQEHVALYGGIAGELQVHPERLKVVGDQLTDGGPLEAAAPETVTRLQFLKQLKALNKVSQIRTLAGTWAPDADARLEWEAGQELRKDGPLVTAVKAELGLTDEQVENFFRGASEL